MSSAARGSPITRAASPYTNDENWSYTSPRADGSPAISRPRTSSSHGDGGTTRLVACRVALLERHRRRGSHCNDVRRREVRRITHASEVFLEQRVSRVTSAGEGGRDHDLRCRLDGAAVPARPGTCWSRDHPVAPHQRRLNSIVAEVAVVPQVVLVARRGRAARMPTGASAPPLTVSVAVHCRQWAGTGDHAVARRRRTVELKTTSKRTGRPLLPMRLCRIHVHREAWCRRALGRRRPS